MKNPTEMLILDDNQDISALEYCRELLCSQKLISVSALAGEIAHKMNNLIGAVIGYTSMLQLDLNSDETPYKYTQSIMEASQGIADLTKNLLSYARAGRGEQSRVNINALLEKTVRIYRNIYKSNVSIGLQITDDPMDVYGNQNMLLLAFANIFINAQEVVSDGGIVNIEARKGLLPENYHFGQPESTNLDYAVISISDNGPGMDENIVKKIFDTIFTIEQNLGDLVGLSAACCIIQKHKGAICVDTEHGDGSKFHIYLPLMQGD